MTSDDIKRIEFKIDLLLKAFLSYSGGRVDDSSQVFEAMKQSVREELLKLMDLPEGDISRSAFVEMIAREPDEMWAPAVEAIMNGPDKTLRIGFLKGIGGYFGGERLPNRFRPLILHLLKSGSSEEVAECVRLFANGCSYGEGRPYIPLFEEEEFQAIVGRETDVRRAAIESFLEWRHLAKSEDWMPEAFHTDFAYAFINDPDKTILDQIAEVFPQLYRAAETDLEPLLKSESERLRIFGLENYLQKREVDMKLVAELVSDPNEKIADMALKYLERRR